MSETFTGMIIGYEPITNQLTKIYLDTLTNDKTRSFISNITAVKLKIGDYVVVYISDYEKEINVELLNKLI